MRSASGAELENEARNRLRENPGDPDGALADYHAQVGRLNDLLPPAVVAEEDRKFNAALVLDRAEGLAESGRADEARAFLDGPDAAGVDPAQIRSAKRRVQEIDNQNRIDHLRDTAGQLGELHYRVGAGEWGRDQILAAEKRGLFQDREGDKWALFAVADAVQKKQIDLDRFRTSAMEKYSTGTGVDTQKEADLVWSEEAKNLPENPGDLPAFAAQFVSQAGLVPTPVQDMIAKGDRPSGTPDNLALAARMHAEIMSRNPSAVTKAGPLVEQTAQLIRDNVPPLEAAKEVQQARTLGPSDQLKAQFKETTKTTEWASDLADRSGVDEDTINSDPRLIDDYRRLTEHYVGLERGQPGARASDGRERCDAEPRGGVPLRRQRAYVRSEPGVGVGRAGEFSALHEGGLPELHRGGHQVGDPGPGYPRRADARGGPVGADGGR